MDYLNGEADLDQERISNNERLREHRQFEVDMVHA